MTRPALLDEAVVTSWLVTHGEWRRENNHLVRTVRTKNYPSSVGLLSALVETAERLDHHPIVTLGYCELRFEPWTHDRGGLTSLDLEYATELDVIALRDFAGDLKTN